MALSNLSQPIIVAGAGPAGITAAYELSTHGISGAMIEADEIVGGISRTVERSGYRFDIGGHRFFSKSAEINSLWEQMLSEPMLTRPRLSRVFYGGKFYDYPLKAGNALRNMGALKALSCVASYALARARPIPDPKSFDEWVTNQFGRRLYEMFFKTYTEKVWGISCSEIGADWAAQRIKGLSLGEAIRNALFGQKKDATVKTLIDEFKYPRLGPGQLWEDATAKLAGRGWNVRTRTRVAGLTLESGAVRGVRLVDSSGKEEIADCDCLLSSMPLRDLVSTMSPAPPEAVLRAATELNYRDFVMIALVFGAESVFPDNWIYIHSPEVKLGRVQNFKNWSAELVADPMTTCLGLEYFCNEGDETWRMPDEALIELGYAELKLIGLAKGDLIQGYVVRMPKAYPVYDTGYAQRLAIIREYLGSIKGLQTIGRNGQHRYNNMDHSMMTALIAARNILGGETRDPWAVNEDAEYHEG